MTSPARFSLLSNGRSPLYQEEHKGNRVEGDSWLGGFTYEEIAEFQDKMADAMRVKAEMEAAAQEAGEHGKVR